MSTLKFINVNKVYENSFHAVYDFNLNVEDKEFIVFVGPSGCGKSTTLRMIAGLEDISSGQIFIDDQLINDVPPKDRNIAMVFQNYALYPHMTVFDNMAFSLKLRKDRFPVIKLDIENPDFIAKLEELNGKYNEDIKEQTAAIKAEPKTPRNIKKDRIKDYKYRRTKQLKADINLLKDEYSSPVLTYDHALVKKLQGELTELEKVTPNDKAAIDAKINEIDEALNQLVEPKYEVRHYNAEETARKVTLAAETLGLEPYLKRKPAALSGGQRQRVALGRAIVRNPKVFLMDEPLSNLDAKLRVQMRSEISKIHQRVGATTIYVTHDQTEAMTMATHIVCMKDGYIQQIGTPKELFNNPSNMFVAGFIGAPAMNFIQGRFDGAKFISTKDQISIDLNSKITAKLKDYIGKPVVLGVRPEDIYLANDKSVESPSVPLEFACDISELLGRELIIYTYVEDQKIVIKVTSRDDVKTGDKEKYVFDMERIHFFDPETTNRIK